MKKTNKVIKTISAVVASAFILQSVSYAAPEIQPAQLPFFQKPMVSIDLPKSVATITDSYQADRGSRMADSGSGSAIHNPQSNILVYLIQDAHTNESAQMNIARSLDTMMQKDPSLKFVFLEAGTGNDSLTFLRDKAPLKKRQQIGREFMRKGYLSGSEYLDLTSDNKMVLWGVEDKKLYWEAVESYGKVAKGREKFQAHLKQVELSINMLKPQLFGPSLKAFDDKHEAYLSEKISLTDYLDTLMSEAGIRSLAITHFPHLVALSKLKDQEKAIDFNKANEEQQKAVSSLSQEDIDLLKEASTNKEDRSPFKVGSSDHKIQKAYYALLEEKLSQRTADSGQESGNRTGTVSSTLTPELMKYFAYLKAADKIDAKSILDEQKLLETQVYDSLIKTQDERSLHEATESLRFLKGLFNLTLTPEEYRHYKKNKDQYSIVNMTGFLNRKIMDLRTQYERVVFLEEGYDDYVKIAERYYQLTYERDFAFLDNMFSTMKLENQKTAALITGGYHTPNLTALLRDKGVSYIVVTPQVLQETNIKKYEQVLLSQKAEDGGQRAEVSGQRSENTRHPERSEGSKDKNTSGPTIFDGPQAGPFVERFGSRLSSSARLRQATAALLTFGLCVSACSSEQGRGLISPLQPSETRQETPISPVLPTNVAPQVLSDGVINIRVNRPNSSFIYDIDATIQISGNGSIVDIVRLFPSGSQGRFSDKIEILKGVFSGTRGYGGYFIYNLKDNPQPFLATAEGLLSFFAELKGHTRDSKEIAQLDALIATINSLKSGARLSSTTNNVAATLAVMAALLVGPAQQRVSTVSPAATQAPAPGQAGVANLSPTTTSTAISTQDSNINIEDLITNLNKEKYSEGRRPYVELILKLIKDRAIAANYLPNFINKLDDSGYSLDTRGSLAAFADVSLFTHKDIKLSADQLGHVIRGYSMHYKNERDSDHFTGLMEGSFELDPSLISAAIQYATTNSNGKFADKVRAGIIRSILSTIAGHGSEPPAVKRLILNTQDIENLLQGLKKFSYRNGWRVRSEIIGIIEAAVSANLSALRGPLLDTQNRDDLSRDVKRELLRVIKLIDDLDKNSARTSGVTSGARLAAVSGVSEQESAYRSRTPGVTQNLTTDDATLSAGAGLRLAPDQTGDQHLQTAVSSPQSQANPGARLASQAEITRREFLRRLSTGVAATAVLSNTTPFNVSLNAQQLPFSMTDSIKSLITFLINNKGERLDSPLSYFVPERFWRTIKYDDNPLSNENTIERLLTTYGINLYDWAARSITLAAAGEINEAEDIIRGLMYLTFTDFKDIRASARPFTHGEKEKILGPDKALFFRMLAEKYLQTDPLDGATRRPGFPTWDDLHHEDWKAILGENAWVVLASLQVAFFKEYYQHGQTTYKFPLDSDAMKLALSLLDAFEAMHSSRLGGLYHVPNGTYGKEPGEIYVENNTSAYAALRELKKAMEAHKGNREADAFAIKIQNLMTGIERYIKESFDPESGVFLTGHVVRGDSVQSYPVFATDAQTWTLLVFGVDWVNKNIGAGWDETAINIWRKTKEKGGYFEEGVFKGVGFTTTENRDILSSEWTVGAIRMADEMADSYASIGRPDLAEELRYDAQVMRERVSAMRGERGGVLYVNKRFKIPFGWVGNALENLAATAWAAWDEMIGANGKRFNPFVLGGGWVSTSSSKRGVSGARLAAVSGVSEQESAYRSQAPGVTQNLTTDDSTLSAGAGSRLATPTNSESSAEPSLSELLNKSLDRTQSQPFFEFGGSYEVRLNRSYVDKHKDQYIRVLRMMSDALEADSGGSFTDGLPMTISLLMIAAGLIGQDINAREDAINLVGIGAYLGVWKVPNEDLRMYQVNLSGARLADELRPSPALAGLDSDQAVRLRSELQRIFPNSLMNIKENVQPSADEADYLSHVISLPNINLDFGFRANFDRDGTPTFLVSLVGSREIMTSFSEAMQGYEFQLTDASHRPISKPFQLHRVAQDQFLGTVGFEINMNELMGDQVQRELWRYQVMLLVGGNYFLKLIPSGSPASKGISQPVEKVVGESSEAVDKNLAGEIVQMHPPLPDTIRTYLSQMLAEARERIEVERLLKRIPEDVWPKITERAVSKRLLIATLEKTLTRTLGNRERNIAVALYPEGDVEDLSFSIGELTSTATVSKIIADINRSLEADPYSAEYYYGVYESNDSQTLNVVVAYGGISSGRLYATGARLAADQLVADNSQPAVAELVETVTPASEPRGIRLSPFGESLGNLLPSIGTPAYAAVEGFAQSPEAFQAAQSNRRLSIMIEGGLSLVTRLSIKGKLVALQALNSKGFLSDEYIFGAQAQSIRRSIVSNFQGMTQGSISDVLTFFKSDALKLLSITRLKPYTGAVAAEVSYVMFKDLSPEQIQYKLASLVAGANSRKGLVLAITLEGANPILAKRIQTVADELGVSSSGIPADFKGLVLEIATPEDAVNKRLRPNGIRVVAQPFTEEAKGFAATVAFIKFHANFVTSIVSAAFNNNAIDRTQVTALSVTPELVDYVKGNALDPSAATASNLSAVWMGDATPETYQAVSYQWPILKATINFTMQLFRTMKEATAAAA